MSGNWKSFLNISGEIVPAYGVIEIDGADTVAGRAVLRGTKPTAAPAETDRFNKFRFNGPAAVPVGAVGRCIAPYDEEWGKYGSGTPVANAKWGPAAGSWDLTLGNNGFRVANGSGGRVLALYDSIDVDSTGDEGTACDCGTCYDRDLLNIEHPSGDFLMMEFYTFNGRILAWDPAEEKFISDTWSDDCDDYDTRDFRYESEITGQEADEVLIHLVDVTNPGSPIIMETWWNRVMFWEPECGIQLQLKRITADGKNCEDLPTPKCLCLEPSPGSDDCVCAGQSYAIRVEITGLDDGTQSDCTISTGVPASICSNLDGVYIFTSDDALVGYHSEICVTSTCFTINECCGYKKEFPFPYLDDQYPDLALQTASGLITLRVQGNISGPGIGILEVFIGVRPYNDLSPFLVTCTGEGSVAGTGTCWQRRYLLNIPTDDLEGFCNGMEFTVPSVAVSSFPNPDKECIGGTCKVKIIPL